MKTLFNAITLFSLRFRWLTLSFVAIMLALGVIAFTRMNQELLPPIELPQTFMLAQANNMTSKQVSAILTTQLERELSKIEEIINIESETTGAFGGTIIAYNDFGLNQTELQNTIRNAVLGAWHPEPDYVYTPDELWLPLRGIAAEDPEADPEFAQRLLGDLTPELMLYLAQNDPNFLFQLEPAVWDSLSDETVRVLLTYLVSQTQDSVSQGTPLERLVAQEIKPQIVTIDAVADVQIAGGQSLDPEASQNQPSLGRQTELLLLLAPDVWDVVSNRFDGLETLDQTAVETIRAANVQIPFSISQVPELPKSWQFPHFATADDLFELETLTEPVASILNDFLRTGKIVGALGQTDDLSANTITNLLALEAEAGILLEESLIQYFTVQQLIAMPQDAFEALPESYLDGLDEFSRQQLEARSEDNTAVSVELPPQWQIPLPQLITFSFADIPLATFSVASVGEIIIDDNAAATAPPLPLTFQQIGSQLGIPLNTADDLLAMQLPEEFAAMNPDGEFGPAQLFNFLTSPMLSLMIPEDQIPEGIDVDSLGTLLLGQINRDVVDYLAENDPTFMESLSENARAALFGAPTTEGEAPALNPQWATLAAFNPNFESLTTSDDLINFPDDFAYENVADLINNLFNDDGGRGFAPELLGNWSVESIRYIISEEPTAFDGLSDEALRLMPEDSIILLPETLQVRAEEVRNTIIPTAQVTRTNRRDSLIVTVFKDADANTVSTYHAVEEAIFQIDEQNPNIEVQIVTEQSSFVEESISGVAREGGLGAVFAVIIILIFLSSGVWGLRGRRMTGLVMIVIFALGLLALVALNLDDGNWSTAWASTDVVFRVLLITGIIAGIAVLFWPGTLPDPAWRATIVIAVSIPLSILTAFALMHWVSPVMYDLIQPLSENEGATGDFFTFILRLFPESLTLNLMTLSGLTVAVGRVVDDSIVVLENIFRQLQAGHNKREAILSGTSDVSAAIFTATIIAVVVFLPLGLTGGIIGAFFLPFGLAITYALAASFIVAITVVPTLAYLTINIDDIPEDKDIWIADYYLPVLRWSLTDWKTKTIVIILAFASAGFGFYLFGQRPAAFLPEFGEPQIMVTIELPARDARITDTNARVVELENFIYDNISAEEITAVQTTVGGFGASFESLFTGNRVFENRAALMIGINVDPETLDVRTQLIREAAEDIFAIQGDDETYVTVSAGSVGGDFGGFALVVTGPDATALAVLDPLVKNVLENIEGIANVTSNLPEQAEGQTAEEARESARTETLIRVNQQTALSYTAELETQDTIGITQLAILSVDDAITAFENGETPEGVELTETQIEAIAALDADTLAAVEVSQGFQSEIQTEGFNSLPIAMGIATVIVIIILLFTFQSAVYWFAIILSIVVAPVGAAVALTLTNRVLGISALIGLLMLLGLVVTNAVVLIDRVRSNRSERGMSLYDSLVEAGGRRLRPILMTSLATIIALIPLAVGLSEGALIASELGTVVIGGVVSSTLLTLIVVPVMYSLMYPLHRRLSFRADTPKEGNQSA